MHFTMQTSSGSNSMSNRDIETVSEYLKLSNRFPRKFTKLRDLAQTIIIVPVVIGLVLVVSLIMLGWVYEGPRRLVYKVLKKGR